MKNLLKLSFVLAFVFTLTSCAKDKDDKGKNTKTDDDKNSPQIEYELTADLEFADGTIVPFKAINRYKKVTSNDAVLVTEDNGETWA